MRSGVGQQGGEISFALGQRLRMGKDFLHSGQLYTRQRDQLVGNRNLRFAHNGQIVAQQQIVVTVNTAGQRVFQRQDAVIDLAAADASKISSKSLHEMVVAASPKKFTAAASL